VTVTMEYRRLGASGLEVARLGLGTAMFGRSVDEATASRILDQYLDAGGNFVDTANIYGGSRDDSRNVPGTTESLLGSIIEGRRHRLIVATKGFGSVERDGWPNSTGLSRASLRGAIEGSLRRLGTDYIDLYQCHSWDFQTPVEETVHVLHEFVQEGKVRYIGVSNWDGWHVTKANLYARLSGLTPLVSNQIWYNLVDRSAENSIIPACKDQGVSIIVWGPLGQGVLDGRFRRGSESGPPPSVGFDTQNETSLTSWKRLATEKTRSVIDALEAAAREHQSTVPNVATRWLLQAGACDVVLLGPAAVEHMTSDLEMLAFRLTAEELADIGQRSAPVRTYPLSMYGRTYDDP
jgi:aryl-alcohol dehydrogenase-like predicted oxidoreductase